MAPSRDACAHLAYLAFATGANVELYAPMRESLNVMSVAAIAAVAPWKFVLFRLPAVMPALVARDQRIASAIQFLDCCQRATVGRGLQFSLHDEQMAEIQRDAP